MSAWADWCPGKFYSGGLDLIIVAKESLLMCSATTRDSHSVCTACGTNSCCCRPMTAKGPQPALVVDQQAAAHLTDRSALPHSSRARHSAPAWHTAYRNGARAHELIS